MALAALSGDEQLVIFSRLCNVLDPGVAVAFASASSELRELTQAERQQLKANYEPAAALCRKAGKRTCKELRESKEVEISFVDLSSDDLALLGTLGSELPALEELDLVEPQRLERGQHRAQRAQQRHVGRREILATPVDRLRLAQLLATPHAHLEAQL